MIRAIFLHGSITNIVFINSNPKVTHQQLHKKKNGQSLAINQYITSLLQPTMWQLMTYLMNHVTSLNNICRWSYKLSRSKL